MSAAATALASLFVFAAVGRSPAQDEPAAPAEIAVSPDDFVTELRRRMAAHRYFSTIVCREDRSTPGFAFLIQAPQVERAGFERAILAEHAPHLAKLEQLFRGSFAEPFGLARRADRPVYAVCVLQTAGDYLNYSRTIEEGASTSRAAYYDRRLRLAVLHHAGHTAQTGAEARFPELAAFARALLHSHYRGEGAEAPSLWLLEGLSRHLARRTLADVAERLEIESLVALAQQPRARGVYALKIADLVALRTPDEVWRAMERRAEAAALPGPQNNEFWWTIGAHAQTWMTYLVEAGEGRFLAGFGKYLSAALEGRAGPQALSESLGADLAELDRSYWRWLFDRHQALHPDRPIDLRVLDHVYDPPPRTDGSAEAGGGGPSTFDATRLAPSPDDVGLEHARQLARAARWDLEGALAGLEALAPRARGGPHARRIESDVSRVRALIELRAAYLESLRASNGRLAFEWGDKKVSARIERVDGGLVHLAENRAGLASVPLSALDVAELMRNLPKELAASPRGWARSYAFVLAGDARIPKPAASDGEELRALLSDAKEWYAGVLRLGRAAELCAELAAAGPPPDRAAAEAALAGVKRLRGEFGDLAFVGDRALALRSLAGLAYAQLFDPKELLGGLAGRVEEFGDGRLRLTYEFERSEEAADFVREPQFWLERRKQLPPLLKTVEQSVMAVSKGALRGSGATAYRLPIAFEQPVTMRCDVRYGYVPDAGTDSSTVDLVLCDDRAGSYVACMGLGGLEAVDKASGSVADEPAPAGIELDPEHAYAIEVRVAGERAASFVDGSQAKEVSVGGRHRGELVLFLHSDAEIAIERLALEGRLDIELCRKVWIAARVAEL